MFETLYDLCCFFYFCKKKLFFILLDAGTPRDHQMAQYKLWAIPEKIQIETGWFRVVCDFTLGNSRENKASLQDPCGNSTLFFIDHTFSKFHFFFIDH